jgi:hypothetical protein
MSFSTNQIYVLTNEYAGTSKQLASNGASSSPVMAAANAADSAEQWYLRPAPLTGHYYLHTRALGDAQALDVYNDQGVLSTQLAFAAAGAYTGQFWRLDRWADGDGTYRLSNNFTGPAASLDTYADTLRPFLDGGDHTGQHWTFGALGGGRRVVVAKRSDVSAGGGPTVAVAGLAVAAAGGLLLVVVGVALAVLVWAKRGERAAARGGLLAGEKAASMAEAGSGGAAPAERGCCA